MILPTPPLPCPNTVRLRIEDRGPGDDGHNVYWFNHPSGAVIYVNGETEPCTCADYDDNSH